MNQEISLKTLPDDISNEIMPLHEGTKVEILEKITKLRIENRGINCLQNCPISIPQLSPDLSDYTEWILCLQVRIAPMQ